MIQKDVSDKSGTVLKRMYFGHIVFF